MLRYLALLLAVVGPVGILGCATQVAVAGPELRTLAERTENVRTGRYDEVERLCAAYQRRWPAQVRCLEFGRTPEGRPMLAIAASADGVLDPAAARAKARPVLLMQGGIHAGEIDGKDAGFLALRGLLEQRVAKGALAAVTLVLVPVLNVDGHERFGRWNRPNQVGPEELGFRTTAQNLNLNRDYVKAEAPEMQALLRLLAAWDPILYVDMHVTDGAQFEHDISINAAPTLAGDPALRAAGVGLRDALMARLRAAGALPLDFYPSFVREEDPSSGFAAIVAAARFSQQYWALRNRLAVLVETHSWKDYGTRVRTTHEAIVAMVALTAERGAAWRAVARASEARAKQLGGSEVALSYGNTPHATTIDFRGYAYTRTPSAISGGLVTRYDPTKPERWRVPLYDQVKPEITAVAPRGGYLVPAAHAAWVLAKLRLHGIEARRLDAPLAPRAVRTFRATAVATAPGTYEGRATLTLAGSWKDERRALPAGSLFVPIAQANAALAMTLLEPRSPDSLAHWGFFSTAFERKEYMEAYVAEQVAAELLAKDPAIRREFEQKLASEPEFAKSEAARLDFFYQKHASWDEAYRLYPVYQIDTAP